MRQHPATVGVTTHDLSFPGEPCSRVAQLNWSLSGGDCQPTLAVGGGVEGRGRQVLQQASGGIRKAAANVAQKTTPRRLEPAWRLKAHRGVEARNRSKFPLRYPCTVFCTSAWVTGQPV